jgi:hypothetical protein
VVRHEGRAIGERSRRVCDGLEVDEVEARVLRLRGEHAGDVGVHGLRRAQEGRDEVAPGRGVPSQGLRNVRAGELRFESIRTGSRASGLVQNGSFSRVAIQSQPCAACFEVSAGENRACSVSLSYLVFEMMKVCALSGPREKLWERRRGGYDRGYFLFRHKVPLPSLFDASTLHSVSIRRDGDYLWGRHAQRIIGVVERPQRYAHRGSRLTRVAPRVRQFLDAWRFGRHIARSDLYYIPSCSCRLGSPERATLAGRS